MPNSDHSVAVVLLNWNNTCDTLACVDSARGVKHSNFTIVIVDNHSRPAEHEKLKSESEGAVILRQSRNRGFSGGCNAGIRWALRHGFQYVWLLNADTVVDPNSLAELVRAIESDPRIAIAGGVIYSSANPDQIQMAGGFIDPKTQRGEMLVPDQIASEDCGIRDVDYVSGAMLLVRSEAVRKLPSATANCVPCARDVPSERRRMGVRPTVIGAPSESMCSVAALVTALAGDSALTSSGWPPVKL